MTSSAGRLPTFLIIGAQKSGTTSLHRLLQQHPEAFLCDPKEPDFFSSPQAWGRGVGWYRSLFAAAGDAGAIGEASTTYSMYPHYAGVVDRALSVLPEPKIVYLTREPLARMRSAYQHALSWGTETRPIGTALLEDPRYLLTSSYALQADQWLAQIPRERLLLLSLEDLGADPARVLERALRFLGIDASWQPAADPAPQNTSAGKRAPRAWWRGAGGLMLRHDKTHWAPHWLARLDERRSPLVRREISGAELEIPAAIADSLRRALAPDLARLGQIWTDSFPGWLDNQSNRSQISLPKVEG